MPSRTEMLHFRVTPEEKAAIHVNAAYADLALSEWLRQSSLVRPAPVVRTAPDYSSPSAEKDMAERFQCCGGPNESGKHLEGCPAVATDDAKADPGQEWQAATQPVEESVKHRIDGELYDVTSVSNNAMSTWQGETYEQFMERRVGELCGENPSPGDDAAARANAYAEWLKQGGERV